MKRLGVSLVVVLLAGCQSNALRPKPVQLQLPVAYSETTGSITAAPEQHWWLAFKDDKLNSLADAGLAGNLDIQQAEARLAAATANITVAGAGGLPQLTLGMGGNVTRETGNMKTTDGTVRTASSEASASWMLDIFGEYRARNQSANALRDAAEAGTDLARLQVLSGVMSSYIDLRYYQERKRIAANSLASRRKTVSLTRLMRSEGVSTDLDVEQANSQVAIIAAELPGYDAGALQSAHRIATLLGRPAASMVSDLEKGRGQPRPAWNAKTGVPADLMRNRPDVRQAEFELASAMAEIGVAEAQLYPTITLSGSITPSYISNSKLDGGLTTWSFGPSLRLPLLDGGKLRANVKVAIAKATEKQAAWKSSVLKAVEEVENALTAYNRDLQTIRAAEAAINSARRTVELSRAAYREGNSTLIDVINAQKMQYEAEAQLADARRSLALHYVQLKIAAGYGLAGPGQALPAALATGKPMDLGKLPPPPAATKPLPPARPVVASAPDSVTEPVKVAPAKIAKAEAPKSAPDCPDVAALLQRKGPMVLMPTTTASTAKIKPLSASDKMAACAPQK